MKQKINFYGCTMENAMNRICISGLRVLATAFVLALSVSGTVAAAQTIFKTPEAAMEAFGAAVIKDDDQTNKTLLGDDYRKILPRVESEKRERFLQAWGKTHKIQMEGQNKAHIAVGDDGWTLPIPLVKGKSGWRFDMKAASAEIRERTIGRNELAVMKVLLAYYDAQKEYAEQDRNGNGVLEYAQKFRSAEGKRDGLYWPAREGEGASPLGDLIAKAAAEGDKPGDDAYHGYRYRILTAQGASAPGGVQDYVVNGKMIGGFGLVAWPVKYGETGVMTFIINHQGVVYEKNLGEKTTETASKLHKYNPDKSWIKDENPS
jgi:Protein of unknown function (DUF2950)